ncbi:MAG: MaoC/PaaZ C-terminal domain-containing protein, partial [Anaerolineae bacterium]|nr:MaoC/PaaZ C-terminal domain-containing protein [Anaerolineae bacterium]
TPLFYEDFDLTVKLISGKRTVTAQDIDAFAALSGDTNPLHIDDAYAATTQYGERIAHGLLGLAMISGLAWQLNCLNDSLEAFTDLKWRYHAPVKIGDTIYAKVDFRKKRPLNDFAGGFVVLDVAVYNQHEELVQKGTWTTLVRSRE